MDAFDQLKQDVRVGRIDAERLIELMVSLQRQLETTQRQLAAAQQRIADLEKKLGGSTPTAKVDEAYSLRAEEKRQEKRLHKKKRRLSKKGRRGRLNSADKLKAAERTDKVFPEGIAPEDCHLSHTRPVWRLENGRAVLIAYAIYRGAKNQYGKIPGVLGRSEFGLEIVVEISYLVYVMGLSFDKVCALLQFLQQLAWIAHRLSPVRGGRPFATRNVANSRGLLAGNPPHSPPFTIFTVPTATGTDRGRRSPWLLAFAAVVYMSRGGSTTGVTVCHS